MKWPGSITLIRHGESAFNALRAEKERDPLWRRFKEAYEEDYRSKKAIALARKVRERHALAVSDYDTPLTDEGFRQAKITGAALAKGPVPTVVFVSPYKRTRTTHSGLCRGWPALADVKTVIDDRIREQEHGLTLLYNDWRAFHVSHPEQKELRDLLGSYWYQYPQGESVSQVRDRIRSFLTMLVREYGGVDERVLLVTHHLTILSFRGVLERLSPEQFMHLDEHEKPVNCGVTTFTGVPGGRDGHLEMTRYNQKFY